MNHTIRVLILSYNALPMEVVSSYRVKAYCEHFHHFGIKPSLVTHRWEKGDGSFVVHDMNASIVFETHDNFDVYRLPYPGKQFSTSPLYTFRAFLNALFDVELIKSYRVFRKFLFTHLKEHKYDLILATFNPHFQLKLAKQCRKKFSIPYIIDFRDLWDNTVITTSYRPSVKKSFIDALIRRKWKSWIRSAMFFSTTGSKWKSYLEKLSGRAGVVVRNGFDENLRISATAPRPPKFKIVHFGRLYVGQNLDIFLNAFSRFAQRYSPDQVGIEIIGLKSVMGADFRPIIESRLNGYVSFIPYMEKSSLLRHCWNEASLFFFPDFVEDNGSFAVKVYDYLLLEKNTIVSPSGTEVGSVVNSTSSGLVTDSEDEIVTYLENCYDEFTRSGYVRFTGDRDAIAEYSRKRQVMILAEWIRKELNSRQ